MRPIISGLKLPYKVVKDAVFGVRIVATTPCSRGSTFTHFDRMDSTQGRTQHSMWDSTKRVDYVARGKRKHIPFYLEHHWQPNLKVSDDSQSVVATRPISPGEYLSIDYTNTEPTLYKQFPSAATDPPVVRPWVTGFDECLSEDGKKWLNVDTDPQDLPTSCHISYKNNAMHFHGINVFDTVRSFDIDAPLYLYSKQALRINLNRVHHYMHKHFQEMQVLYSVKANSSKSILCELRHAGQSHLDVCSPQEIDRARECGFDVANMQYTGTNLSDTDLQQVGRHPGLKLNCDSLSLLKRIPRSMKHVGLRLDPRVGMAYKGEETLQCTLASKPSKMGIPLSDIRRACSIARDRNIPLERIHAHVGNSFQTEEDMASLETVLQQVAEAISICAKEGYDITEVNLGGGFGVPYLPGEYTFDWDAWAHRVKQFPTIATKRVIIEPGDAIVKNAGILVSRVTDMYEKSGSTFVGLCCGMNLNPLPANYGVISYPYPVLQPPTGTDESVNVVGNLNESIDVWCEGATMRLPVCIGDHVALVNSGGYAHSCRTTHSLRTHFNVILK